VRFHDTCSRTIAATSAAVSPARRASATNARSAAAGPAIRGAARVTTAPRPRRSSDELRHGPR
jgi:hypothetical protein